MFPFQVTMILKEKGIVEQKAKRAKYEEGYAPDKFKNSGVEKIFYIALLPSSKENRDNTKTLIKDLYLERINPTYSMDCKMILYCIGKMDGSCKHPCYACTGFAPWTGKGKGNPMTVGMLKAFLAKYRAAVAEKGENNVEGKDEEFNNVVNEILFAAEAYSDDTLVEDFINIPCLHILLGIVKRAVEHMKNAVGKKEIGESWFAPVLKTLNITENYYNGRRSLNGNSCHKLINNSDKLMELAEPLTGNTKVTVVATIKALKAFGRVVHSCFGNQIRGDYVSDIQEFSKCWRAIPKITIPLKVHLLEDHTVPFLARYIYI